MQKSYCSILPHSKTHTLRRTPLDEESAPRTDIYLSTHNTHMRQTSMPPPGFEPAIRANERSQTNASDHMTNVNSVITKLYSSSVSCVRTEGSKVICCSFHAHNYYHIGTSNKTARVWYSLLHKQMLCDSFLFTGTASLQFWQRQPRPACFLLSADIMIYSEYYSVNNSLFARYFFLPVAYPPWIASYRST